MKKALLLIAVLFCAAAITASAQTAPARKAMTPEQKALRTEMLKKYDANGDKKIDADEAAKISADDKAKMKEAGVSITGRARKKAQ